MGGPAMMTVKDAVICKAVILTGMARKACTGVGGAISKSCDQVIKCGMQK
jgi:hypothetical protein